MLKLEPYLDQSVNQILTLPVFSKTFFPTKASLTYLNKAKNQWSEHLQKTAFFYFALYVPKSFSEYRLFFEKAIIKSENSSLFGWNVHSIQISN